MPFKVELGVESYRIVGPNGEEGPLYTFDQIASIKIGNDLYYCDVQFDGTDTEALDEQLVECVLQSRAEATEVLDVLFPGEEAESDDEDDEEGDDDDDAPGPTLVA